jgi:hypothetical protein
MEDRVMKQIADILEAKDREALLELHKDALEKEDWKQAHGHLMELTLKLLENSTKIMADMRRQQEATATEIKAVEKRLASLL